MTGQTVGRYRILEKLGEGGMGVVYKAEDTKLEREVALKLLPAHLLGNEDVRKRFEREAKASAALSHPNICRVYEIDEAEGKTFLAMELIEGESLDKKIARGPLKIEEALSIGQQLAKGLEAAHKRGIVHRDIKPENIMVGEDGQVTIMDFGLAQLTEASRLTKMDETLGTVAYMSPEQTEGSGTDRRTDLWALGVVLYEMVTGQQPFKGDYDKAVMYSILNEEPEPITALRTGVPMELERIANKCLAKRSEQRYQTATDLIVDLRALSQAQSAAPAPSRVASVVLPPRRSRNWVLTSGLVAAAVALTWWLATSHPSRERTPEYRFSQLTFDSGLTFEPAISPDGQLLAYASDRSGEGQLDIWVRQLGGGSPPIRLTSDPADDLQPNFSPDGRTIAFHSRRDGGGVYTIPALGGRERLIAAGGQRPRFSPDGASIAYWRGGSLAGVPLTASGGNGTIFVVPSQGGEPQRWAPDLESVLYPIWRPDGQALVSLSRSGGGFDQDWWTIPAAEGKPRRFPVAQALSLEASNVVYPSAFDDAGVLLSLARGSAHNIWRIRTSAPDWLPEEEPEPLTRGPGAQHDPAAGPAGAILFAEQSWQVDLWLLPLDPATGLAAGPPERLTSDPSLKAWPTISPDGAKAAFVSDRGGNEDIFLMDVASGEQFAIAATGDIEQWPALDNHGEVAAFYVQGDTPRIEIVPTAGGGRKTIQLPGARFDDLSADGEFALYRISDHIFRYDFDAGHADEIIAPQGLNPYQSRFSPDNRLVIFMARPSDNPDRSELFVARIDGAIPVPRDAWVRVSAASATYDKPRWGRRGDRIYYTATLDGFPCIWTQSLDPATHRPAGDPEPVFHSHDPRRSIYSVGVGYQEISVARDKILFNMAEVTGNIWMMRLE